MKKTSTPLYLTAKEAAGELGISLPTLYAYVSRGLVRSEPDPGSRGRRYRGEDVRALGLRRGSPEKDTTLDRTALSWGTPLIESSITCITAAGPHYRGLAACDLAATATLEQVASLLWGCGEDDPFAPGSDGLSDGLADGSGGQLAPELFQALGPLRAIDRLAAIMAVAGDLDDRAHSRTAAGQAATGARILRLAAQVVLGVGRLDGPIHLALARHWAPQAPAAADILRSILVLLADHELNASTFTARCAASTGASLYDVVAAGLVALKGPKHGGAASRAAWLVKETPDGDMIARAKARAALGEAFAGFGHRLYPEGDPRARALLAALAKTGAPRRLVEDLPGAVTRVTGEEPNIDYALAVASRVLALPEGAELTLFALSRTAGWIAHGIEQRRQNDLIRPRARYCGPPPRFRPAPG